MIKVYIKTSVRMNLLDTILFVSLAEHTVCPRRIVKCFIASRYIQVDNTSLTYSNPDKCFWYRRKCINSNIKSKCVCCTVCPRSLYPFYIMSYYINWAKTSWTYSTGSREKMNRPLSFFFLILIPLKKFGNIFKACLEIK